MQSNEIQAIDVHITVATLQLLTWPNDFEVSGFKVNNEVQSAFAYSTLYSLMTNCYQRCAKPEG